MRVIFLDIDGVLITSNNNLYELSGGNGQNESSGGLDSAAVYNLNRLLKETNARIVISSSLRFSNSVSHLITILKNGGVTDPPVIDVTPFIPDRRSNRSHRGTEILTWLSRHPDVENYIVIDDCDDRQLTGIPQSHIVKTVYRSGFGNSEAYKRALEILEEVPVE